MRNHDQEPSLKDFLKEVPGSLKEGAQQLVEGAFKNTETVAKRVRQMVERGLDAAIQRWEQIQNEKAERAQYSRVLELSGFGDEEISKFSEGDKLNDNEYAVFLTETSIKEQAPSSLGSRTKEIWAYGMYKLYKNSQEKLFSVLETQVSRDVGDSELIKNSQEIQESRSEVGRDLLNVVETRPELLLDFYENLVRCENLAKQVHAEEDSIRTESEGRSFEKKLLTQPYHDFEERRAEAFSTKKKGRDFFDKLSNWFFRLRNKSIEQGDASSELLRQRAGADLTKEEIVELLGLETDLAHKSFLKTVNRFQPKEGEQILGTLDREEDLRAQKEQYEQSFFEISKILKSASSFQGKALEVAIKKIVDVLKDGKLSSAEASAVSREMNSVEQAIGRKGGGKSLLNDKSVSERLKQMHGELSGGQGFDGKLTEANFNEIKLLVEERVYSDIARDVYEKVCGPSQGGSRKEELAEFFRECVLQNPAFPSMAEASVFLGKVLEKIIQKNPSIEIRDDSGQILDTPVLELNGQGTWLRKWPELLNKTSEALGGHVDIEEIYEYYANFDLSWMDNPGNEVSPEQDRSTSGLHSKGRVSRRIQRKERLEKNKAHPETNEDDGQKVEQVLTSEKAREKIDYSLDNIGHLMEVVTSEVDGSVYKKRSLKDLISESKKLLDLGEENIEKFVKGDGLNGEQKIKLHEKFTFLTKSLARLLEKNGITGKVEGSDTFSKLAGLFEKSTQEQGLETLRKKLDEIENSFDNLAYLSSEVLVDESVGDEDTGEAGLKKGEYSSFKQKSLKELAKLLTKFGEFKDSDIEKCLADPERISNDQLKDLQNSLEKLEGIDLRKLFRSLELKYPKDFKSYLQQVLDKVVEASRGKIRTGRS